MAARDHAQRAPEGQQDPVRAREPRLRPTLQVLLAIAAIGVFILFVFAWRGDVLDAEPSTFLPLLALLLLILVVEVVLLRPIYERLFRPLPLPVAPDKDNYVVGCSGCGTVFTITDRELEAGRFACQNCGRTGYVKDHNLTRQAIQREVCKTCGNAYMEFLEHSECPVCHTFNQY